MSGKNYIPSSDLKFLEWSKKLVGYAMANYQRWGVIDPKDMLETLLEDFDGKLKNANLPDSGAITKRIKNEARTLLERAIRAYVQGFLARNPLVNTDDRGELGLPVYDRIPTPVAVPAGLPKANITLTRPLQLMVNIIPDQNEPDKRVTYGCRIYYGTYAPADTPPANGKDLRESFFTRKKKELIKFQPEDAGKTAFFSIRYENSKGQAGQYGPLASSIIP